MCFEGDRMSYSCPRCDKPLRTEEVDAKKCSNCGIGFKVTKDTNVAIYQERALVAQLAKEVFGLKGTRIDYYNTAINILKSALLNVIYSKSKRHTTFYRIIDGEIKYFLFRLTKTYKSIRIEFDMRLGYKKVKNYSDEYRLRGSKGRLKSYLNTKDLELLVDVCMAVCEIKNKRYGKQTQLVDIVVKY